MSPKPTDLEQLSQAEDSLRDYGDSRYADCVAMAHMEILVLRAAGFRWVPVGESKPPSSSKELVVVRDGGGNLFLWVANCVDVAGSITHWLMSPPLPEKSQEEKDGELWKIAEKTSAWSGQYEREIGRVAFLMGLRAAREAK